MRYRERQDDRCPLVVGASMEIRCRGFRVPTRHAGLDNTRTAIKPRPGQALADSPPKSPTQETTTVLVHPRTERMQVLGFESRPPPFVEKRRFPKTLGFRRPTIGVV